MNKIIQNNYLDDTELKVNSCNQTGYKTLVKSWTILLSEYIAQIIVIVIDSRYNF